MSKLADKQRAKEQAEQAAFDLIKASPLAKLIDADIRTEVRADKLATEIYNNLVNLLEACESLFKNEFQRAAIIRLLEEKYEKYPNKLAIRKTIINNAYKLTLGAKVNGKWVNGIGFAKMLAAVKDCEDKTLQGIRDALVAAKPDSMKTHRSSSSSSSSSSQEPLALDSGVDPASLSHAERLREALRYLSCCTELLKIADGDEELIQQISKLREAFNAKLVKDQQAA